MQRVCLSLALILGLQISSSAQTVISRTVVPAQRLAAPVSKAAADGTPPTATVPSQTGTIIPTPVAPTATPAQLTLLQAVQQAQFDRRPSAILKAWSTPPKSAEDEKPEGAESTPAADAGSEDPAAQAAALAAQQVAEENARVQESVESLQRDVTLGNWDGVKTFLGSMEEAERKPSYEHILRSLARRPANSTSSPAQMINGQMVPTSSSARNLAQQFAEKNYLNFSDVLALVDCYPGELEDSSLALIGMLTRATLAGGSDLQQLLQLLRQEVRKPEDSARLTARQVAGILIQAGQAKSAGEFLPSTQQAVEADDAEALNMLSDHFLALYQSEAKTEHLEQAWRVTQAVLRTDQVERTERVEALQRAVELAPKIRESLGQTWLNESFTQEPERGIEILATIGSLVSQGIQRSPTGADSRLRLLELQKTAVEALLEVAPQRAQQWRDSLTLLTLSWLNEADFSARYDTSTSRGPLMQRDAFGNLYYLNSQQLGGRAQVGAIETGELLELRPSEAWLDLINPSLLPRYATVVAQLLLKVNEEDAAFPYIEQLAQSHPEQAKELAEEFLRVWTRNHDPNQNQNRANPYIYVYGFERKAQSIPLTRSKQERNLRDLAEWIRRLKDLPIPPIDEQLITRAFTTSHSTAEVYRLESIEQVFGSVADLDPETLAQLAQRMRSNLVGVWRQPAVQQDKQTNRKKKDIEAEVLRGYEVAQSVVDDALKRHPNHWALTLAQASLIHDENNYRQEVAKSSEFTETRLKALQGFAKAADQYAQTLSDLPEDEESTEVYEQWFYASLGACDLGAIDSEKQLAVKQPAMIRAHLQGLPAAAAERHQARFANSLFTRMSAVNPAVKFRYLSAGFEIIGDHKQAHEARKVYDYYHDLITEIKLETILDGPDQVGYQEPFGVFVNLKHTREIERESGGFSKYLQNQNNQMNAYNYGRPTENYRDKFQEYVTQKLSEHFEVLSVTFQSDKVNSRALEGEYGWRYTPYAYLLLKARGPEVDKLPSLQLDLDFLDTSGYAILPIESAVVPLDASRTSPETRPFAGVEITQTLDERQADEGKLLLEVKAVGKGLMPAWEQLFKFQPQDFNIDSIEDQGVSVSHFDEESPENVVISERNWIVTLQGKEDLPEQPKMFSFAQPSMPDAATVYQRYVDADLQSVEQDISLEQNYGEVARFPWLPVLGLGLAVLIAAILILRRVGKSTDPSQESLRLPESLTPFTVLGFLRELEQEHVSEDDRVELAASIRQIEESYFADRQQSTSDLRDIAESWLNKSRQARRHA